MKKPDKIHTHLSSLLVQARQKKGFATLKELYRAFEPSINYQTWVHAESGRRVPTAKAVIMMGEILDIDREALIIAYCKDKFDDPKSLHVVETFQHKQFVSANALIDAKDHDRSDDYVFTTEQVKAIQKDIRLRLYLNYTYDRKLTTTLDRLAQFFGVEKSSVKEVIDQLQHLGLVEVNGDKVKRFYPCTTLPKTDELFDVRRQILLKSLELNIKPGSYITNYDVIITEHSYKKILAFFDFVEANIIKMVKEDKEAENGIRFQIAIAGNSLREGNDNERKQKLKSSNSQRPARGTISI